MSQRVNDQILDRLAQWGVVHVFGYLWDRYGYDSAMYGHFGMGCIHCRMNFDLTSQAGIAPLRRQHVRLGHTPGFHRQRDRLRVDRVVLAPMLAHADLPDARGIEHPGSVAPLRQRVVHMPPLTACLKSNLGRRRLRAETRSELREASDRPTIHDFAVLYSAKRDMACAQIQSYAAHD